MDSSLLGLNYSKDHWQEVFNFVTIVCYCHHCNAESFFCVAEFFALIFKFAALLVNAFGQSIPSLWKCIFCGGGVTLWHRVVSDRITMK